MASNDRLGNENSAPESSAQPLSRAPAILHPVHAWWTVIVLMILNTVSLFDRYILSLMVIEIREDLGLNDFQISLFQGLAFVIFFSVAGVFVGRLVDSYPAKRILYACVTIWSIAATVTGLVKNYWGMIAARMVTGAGEGGVNPSAQTLIASLFPRNRVSLPMSLFTLSGAIGIGLSFFGGGLLLQMFTAESVPGLESLAPWRQVLVVTALPGILIAFLSFTLLEARPLARKQAPLVESWRELFQFLAIEWRLFLRLAIGFLINTIIAYSVFSWAPTYGRRVLGISSVEIGTQMGLITTIGGISAAAMFGYIVDLQFSRGKIDFVMRAYAFGALAAIPFCLVGFLADQHAAFLVALIAVQCLVSAALGPATAALQIATPPELRGRMAAALLVVVNAGGLAIGPTMVGALTEYVFVDPMQVGNSIAVTVCILGPISAFSMWTARSYYVERLSEPPKRPDNRT